MTWTTEKEQREATARKAHDAYAAARQADEKAGAAKAAADAVGAELDELRSEVERLRVVVDGLANRRPDLIDPIPFKTKRKAA